MFSIDVAIIGLTKLYASPATSHFPQCFRSHGWLNLQMQNLWIQRPTILLFYSCGFSPLQSHKCILPTAVKEIGEISKGLNLNVSFNNFENCYVILFSKLSCYYSLLKLCQLAIQVLVCLFFFNPFRRISYLVCESSLILNITSEYQTISRYNLMLQIEAK